jgi:hypothetical protein
VKLIPNSFDRSFENGPKLSIGCMAMVLSILVRYAHPNGNLWHFIAGFLTGLSIALIVADFYGRWRARARK